MSGIRPKESAKCSQVIDFSNDLDSIEDIVTRTADCHLFSRTIQLLTTDHQLLKEVEEYAKSSKSLSYFLLKDIPIHVFIDEILINGFVKTGKLFAVSVGKQIDIDDCLTLLPEGTLVLSVKESTYRRIGIVGKKSILYRKKNCVQKYVIEIDLTDKHMTRATKFYKRYDECLRRSGLVFDVFIKWQIVSEELKAQQISSISIRNFFTRLKTNSTDDSISELKCFRCLPSLASFSASNVPIPLLSDQVIEEDIHSLIEWFGAQLCRIDCRLSQESDVSTFGLTNYDTNEDIYFLSISGFFTSSDVQSLLSRMKAPMKADKHISAIIVNGFEDSAVTWMGKNNEHSKNLSGENMYGFALFRGLALVWRFADEYDFGIERI